jgi:hypothetical protein
MAVPTQTTPNPGTGQSSWPGILEMIGGGVLTAFGGGAVGIPLIMGGVSNLSSAHAANQQIAASQGVQQLNQNVYQGLSGQFGNILQQQQANLTPYSSLGSGAASLLGKGLGVNVSLPQTTAFTPQAGIGVAGPQLGANQSPTGQLQAAPPGMTLATLARNGVVPGGSLTPYRNPNAGSPQLEAQAQSQSSYSGPGGVTMRAPDGSTETVDPQHVAFFQQHGAQVV